MGSIQAWGLCWAMLSTLISLQRPSPLQREHVGDLHPALFKHSMSSHKLGGRVVHLCFLFKYIHPLVAALQGGALQSVGDLDTAPLGVKHFLAEFSKLGAYNQIL